jgi:hypothetical protein
LTMPAMAFGVGLAPFGTAARGLTGTAEAGTTDLAAEETTALTGRILPWTAV